MTRRSPINPRTEYEGKKGRTVRSTGVTIIKGHKQPVNKYPISSTQKKR